MDIQKEREAFQKFCEENFDFENHEQTYFDDQTQCYENDVGEDTASINIAWMAWQQAQKVAVPEGFVLVPKEIPKSFDEGLYFYSNSISVVNEYSDGFIPMSDIDHSEIWKLVIKAQEQVG